MFRDLLTQMDAVDSAQSKLRNERAKLDEMIQTNLKELVDAKIVKISLSRRRLFNLCGANGWDRISH